MQNYLQEIPLYIKDNSKTKIIHPRTLLMSSQMASSPTTITTIKFVTFLHFAFQTPTITLSKSSYIGLELDRARPGQAPT